MRLVVFFLFFFECCFVSSSTIGSVGSNIRSMMEKETSLMINFGVIVSRLQLTDVILMVTSMAVSSWWWRLVYSGMSAHLAMLVMMLVMRMIFVLFDEMLVGFSSVLVYVVSDTNMLNGMNIIRYS